MNGLDTNVLLRYLLGDDAAQTARAARELERDDRFLIDGRTFDRSLKGLDGFRLL